MSETQLSVKDFIEKLETTSNYTLEFGPIPNQWVIFVQEDGEVKKYVSPGIQDLSPMDAALLYNVVDRRS